jgi:hypothetical protein
MKIFKNAVLLLIIFLMTVYLFLFQVKGITVAPLFNVDVNPINAGSVAEYRIYGSYSEYNKINVFKVYFKADTSFLSPGAPKGSVLVNGIPVLGTQFNKIESDGSIESTLYLSQYLNPGDNIEILFKKEAGIRNPITPATCYKVRVVLINYNGVEVGTILSNSYRITSSVVQGLTVNVNPAIRGMKAEYVVSFATGARGALNSNSGGIKVKFPEGTMFPNSLSKTNILINNSPISAIYRDTEESNVVRVYSPFDIPANYPVTLVFKKELGLSNPLQTGLKKILVSTDSEPDWVESAPFEIYEPEIQDLSISLSPDSIALHPEINMNFKTSPVGFLSKGEKIYIEFLQGFQIPSAMNSDFVFANGQNTEAFSMGNIIEIVSPQNITPLSQVEVKILKEAGITNPSFSGDYTINVWTDADSFKSQFKVNIKTSTVDDVELEAEYSGLNTINAFKVSFKTGPVYTLVKDIDRIKITFDENFVYPDDPLQNLITVNGTINQNVAIEVHSLYITTPLDIQPGSLVEVEIPETFGIKNPANLGEYGVRVSTSKEVQEVESNKIKITPLPVVEFTINPSQPDGMNGFYKTNPEIMLSTSNGVKVFFKVDDGEFAEFTAPFKIDEGAHTIYAYAMDEGGNKGDTIKREFNVDNTPPKITFDNANSDPYFKESPGKLTGNVSEPCTLKINEVILELKYDLHFSVELNVYEGMPIALFARDIAGNTATLLLTAHIDSKPPVITFISKVNRVQGLGVNSVETTEPAYTIQLKIDEKGKVFVNSNEMFFDGQTYSYNANLIDGDNQFIIKAVDAAGNEAIETLLIKKVNEKKITLQIGSNLATVGSETIELEAPPVIEKGFTLVPLRFISEAFGASVDWNDALKVITINYRTLAIQLQVGSTVAVVDNSIVKLDAPPKIINGRTLVPIRFISETFGATVDWDGTTKTVTIVYKP